MEIKDNSLFLEYGDKQELAQELKKAVDLIVSVKQVANQLFWVIGDLILYADQLGEEGYQVIKALEDYFSPSSLGVYAWLAHNYIGEERVKGLNSRYFMLAKAHPERVKLLEQAAKENMSLARFKELLGIETRRTKITGKLKEVREDEVVVYSREAQEVKERIRVKGKARLDIEGEL